jgi:hypothetical protein
MAGKPKNRLELRRQYEAAEPADPMEEDDSTDSAEDGGEDEDGGRRSRTKKKAPPKPKAKAKPKAKPKSSKAAKPAARMRIVWGVVSDAFKTVATFDYSQRDAALARAAELTAKGKGTHFLQKVKEAMPDDAPGLGAAIPRAEIAPAKAAAASPKATKAAAVEDDEPEEDEEEEEVEVEEEEE